MDQMLKDGSRSFSDLHARTGTGSTSNSRQKSGVVSPAPPIASSPLQEGAPRGPPGIECSPEPVSEGLEQEAGDVLSEFCRSKAPSVAPDADGTPDAFNEQDIDILRRLFATYDPKGTGAFDLSRFPVLLNDVGVEHHPTQLSDWLARAGLAGKLSADFDSFLRLMHLIRADGAADDSEAIDAFLTHTAAALKAQEQRLTLLDQALEANVITLESTTRWTLDVLCVCVTTYYSFVFPLRIAGMHLPSLLWAEGACTIFLLGEVVANTRTAAVQDGWVLDDPGACCAHYMRTWMAADLLSSLPFDLIAVAVAGEEDGATWYAALQSLRLLRILKLNKLFALTPRGFFPANLVWIKVTVVPLFMLAVRTLTLLHWFTAAWILVFPDVLDLQDPYLTAAYWVIETVSTVGYGDLTVRTRAQRVLCMVLFSVGIVVNGYIASRITQLLVQADLSQDRDAVLQRTLAVLRQFHVAPDMEREVLSFQFHTLSSNTSLTFQEVTAALPASMRMHIAIFVRIHIVSRVPSFAAATAECKVALAQALEELVFPPDQRIIEQGEEGREMYFIMHGCCSVHTSDGGLIRVLRRGQFFGHVALMGDHCERTASVTTITYTALLVLRKQEFEAIRKQFREFNEALEQERLDEARALAAQGRVQQGLRTPGTLLRAQSLMSQGSVPLPPAPPCASPDSRLDQHRPLPLGRASRPPRPSLSGTEGNPLCINANIFNASNDNSPCAETPRKSLHRQSRESILGAPSRQWSLYDSAEQLGAASFPRRARGKLSAILSAAVHRAAMRRLSQTAQGVSIAPRTVMASPGHSNRSPRRDPQGDPPIPAAITVRRSPVHEQSSCAMGGSLNGIISSLGSCDREFNMTFPPSRQLSGHIPVTEEPRVVIGCSLAAPDTQPRQEVAGVAGGCSSTSSHPSQSPMQAPRDGYRFSDNATEPSHPSGTSHSPRLPQRLKSVPPGAGAPQGEEAARLLRSVLHNVAGLPNWMSQVDSKLGQLTMAVERLTRAPGSGLLSQQASPSAGPELARNRSFMRAGFSSH
eukprot:TRINITY_DN18425_c0_g1_i1.p1 TRINITY_DN18425_c0_g1~~TRINITY_DN18425_c0_g1_i1.p1  ORF type:complete len:1072 (+),score=283.39 TRINITY_DN18425_c0_g1_i1:105-3218(+)